MFDENKIYIYKIYKLKACLKRYALRWHLKLESEKLESGLDILEGRLFQRFGAA